MLGEAVCEPCYSKIVFLSQTNRELGGKIVSLYSIGYIYPSEFYKKYTKFSSQKEMMKKTEQEYPSFMNNEINLKYKN